jgi:hypothetical protein
MARATATQRTQIGKEAVPGTAVPANKVLGSVGLTLNPAVESEAFRPKGSKLPTLVNVNKEWVAIDVDGTATYDEIVYLLASVMGTPVVSQIMDGATPTGAYKWVFSPSSSGIDTPQTYTVEEGDASIAAKASYGLFTDFDLDMNRGEISMGASGIAQRLTTGVALTAGATNVVADQSPILPGQVCIYVADTPAALEITPGVSDPTKRWGTALSIHPTVGGRFDPVWYLNCTQQSFGAHIETPEPDYTLDFMAEANAQAMVWLDHFRTGKTQFVRIEATGNRIYDGAVTDQFYSLVWDFAVKVLEPGEKSDEDGVYAVAPSLQIVHDAAWGRATRLTVVNKVSAL